MLASSIFFLSIIVGNIIGNVLGKFLYFFYNNIMFLNMPDFMNISAPIIIGGLVGGLLAGYINIKIYKDLHFGVSIIIPIIILISALYAQFIYPPSDGSKLAIWSAVIAIFVNGYCYISLLYAHVKGE